MQTAFNRDARQSRLRQKDITHAHKIVANITVPPHDFAHPFGVNNSWKLRSGHLDWPQIA